MHDDTAQFRIGNCLYSFSGVWTFEDNGPEGMGSINENYGGKMTDYQRNYMLCAGERDIQLEDMEVYQLFNVRQEVIKKRQTHTFTDVVEEIEESDHDYDDPRRDFDGVYHD